MMDLKKDHTNGDFVDSSLSESGDNVTSNQSSLQISTENLVEGVGILVKNNSPNSYVNGNGSLEYSNSQIYGHSSLIREKMAPEFYIVEGVDPDFADKPIEEVFDDSDFIYGKEGHMCFNYRNNNIPADYYNSDYFSDGDNLYCVYYDEDDGEIKISRYEDSSESWTYLSSIRGNISPVGSNNGINSFIYNFSPSVVYDDGVAYLCISVFNNSKIFYEFYSSEDLIEWSMISDLPTKFEVDPQSYFSRRSAKEFAEPDETFGEFVRIALSDARYRNKTVMRKSKDKFVVAGFFTYEFVFRFETGLRRATYSYMYSIHSNDSCISFSQKRENTANSFSGFYHNENLYSNRSIAISNDENLFNYLNPGFNMIGLIGSLKEEEIENTFAEEFNDDYPDYFINFAQLFDFDMYYDERIEDFVIVSSFKQFLSSIRMKSSSTAWEPMFYKFFTDQELNYSLTSSEVGNFGFSKLKVVPQQDDFNYLFFEQYITPNTDARRASLVNCTAFAFYSKKAAAVSNQSRLIPDTGSAFFNPRFNWSFCPEHNITFGKIYSGGITNHRLPPTLTSFNDTYTRQALSGACMRGGALYVAVNCGFDFVYPDATYERTGMFCISNKRSSSFDYYPYDNLTYVPKLGPFRDSTDKQTAYTPNATIEFTNEESHSAFIPIATYGSFEDYFALVQCTMPAAYVGDFGGRFLSFPVNAPVIANTYKYKMNFGIYFGNLSIDATFESAEIEIMRSVVRVDQATTGHIISHRIIAERIDPTSNAMKYSYRVGYLDTSENFVILRSEELPDSSIDFDVPLFFEVSFRHTVDSFPSVACIVSMYRKGETGFKSNIKRTSFELLSYEEIPTRTVSVSDPFLSVGILSVDFVGLTNTDTLIFRLLIESVADKREVWQDHPIIFTGLPINYIAASNNDRISLREYNKECCGIRDLLIMNDSFLTGYKVKSSSAAVPINSGVIALSFSGRSTQDFSRFVASLESLYSYVDYIFNGMIDSNKLIPEGETADLLSITSSNLRRDFNSICLFGSSLVNPALSFSDGSTSVSIYLGNKQNITSDVIDFFSDTIYVDLEINPSMAHKFYYIVVREGTSYYLFDIVDIKDNCIVVDIHNSNYSSYGWDEIFFCCRNSYISNLSKELEILDEGFNFEFYDDIPSSSIIHSPRIPGKLFFGGDTSMMYRGIEEYNEKGLSPSTVRSENGKVFPRSFIEDKRNIELAMYARKNKFSLEFKLFRSVVEYLSKRPLAAFYDSDGSYSYNKSIVFGNTILGINPEFKFTEDLFLSILAYCSINYERSINLLKDEGTFTLTLEEA